MLDGQIISDNLQDAMSLRQGSRIRGVKGRSAKSRSAEVQKFKSAEVGSAKEQGSSYKLEPC